MELTLHKQIRENAPLRKSFDALAQKTFGISFEGWYRAGHWSDSYIPYVLAEGIRCLQTRPSTLWTFYGADRAGAIFRLARS